MTKETLLLEALKKIAEPNQYSVYVINQIASQDIAAYEQSGDAQEAIKFAEWIINRNDWDVMQGNFDWAKTTTELYQLFINNQQEK